MKFRVDIGPESLKKYFSRRKLMKNHEKSPKSTAGPRGVPATYYGSSHWKFLGIFEKSRTKKSFFFEHETKTQKFDLASFSIRSSAYVAQFLDRLEHSECTNLFGDFFFSRKCH